jgi:hypothetical protein
VSSLSPGFLVLVSACAVVSLVSLWLSYRAGDFGRLDDEPEPEGELEGERVPGPYDYDGLELGLVGRVEPCPGSGLPLIDNGYAASCPYCGVLTTAETEPDGTRPELIAHSRVVDVADPNR